MSDELSGPEFARIARARTTLEDACAGVVEMAQDVDDCTPMGTDELPAAVAARESSECVDEDDAGALLCVSQACRCVSTKPGERIVPEASTTTAPVPAQVRTDRGDGLTLDEQIGAVKDTGVGVHRDDGRAGEQDASLRVGGPALKLFEYGRAGGVGGSQGEVLSSRQGGGPVRGG